MFMRYMGGGIGHLGLPSSHIHWKSSETTVEDDTKNEDDVTQDDTNPGAENTAEVDAEVEAVVVDDPMADVEAVVQGMDGLEAGAEEVTGDLQEGWNSDEELDEMCDERDNDDSDREF